MTTKGRVLIANHDDRLLDPVIRALKQDGYQCVAVKEKAVVIPMLKKEPYDLLLINITFNSCNEMTLINRVNEIIEGLPIIVFARKPSLEMAIQAIELPIAAFLTEPLDTERLRQHVHKAVNCFRQLKYIQDRTRHLRRWGQDLEKCNEIIENSSGLGQPSFRTFLAFMVNNSIKNLAAIQHLFNSWEDDKSEEKVCSHFDCPRLKSLMSTLIETIDVLEKTRSSFRSKDLGRLRLKILAVIEDMALKG